MIRYGRFTVDPDRGLVYGPRGRPLGGPNRDGYLVTRDKRYTPATEFIHRLVWAAVRGPIPDGMEVNHRNGIKADNRLANLELATRAQNMQHAFDTGLTSNAGEQHPGARLTETDVLDIRRRADAGESKADLAAEYGVHRRHINAISLRRSWAHVPEAGGVV